MRQLSTVLGILTLPFGCTASRPVDPQRLGEIPADGRPAVGHQPVDTPTELARRENAPGLDPPAPTGHGSSSPAFFHPRTKPIPRGFAVELPTVGKVLTPAYYRGRVYASVEHDYDLYAINAATGRTEWGIRLSDDGPSSPACTEEVCVFNTSSCTMFGVAAATGRQLWAWWLGSLLQATPMIAGRSVYTSYPGPSTERRFVLAAFDLHTGDPQWRRWIDGEVNAAPVADRGRVYAATTRGTLYELVAATGEIIAVRHNHITSAPVVSARDLFFGRHEPTGLQGSEMLLSHVILPELEVIDVATPAKPERGDNPEPRPLLVHQRVLTVRHNLIEAADRNTGRLLWQSQIPAAAAPLSAPLLAAGPYVLVATTTGNLLGLDPDTGRITTSFHLGLGPLASPPIVHAGWIYAGNAEGMLVGYNTGRPEITGWEMYGGGADRRGIAQEEGV